MFSYFYHERIRRSVGSFGALFNNMYVIRKNKGGASTSQIKVPLSYAPKRKFIERLEEDNKNDLNELNVVAIKLPRMSFEITSLTYDPTRQINKMNNCIVGGVTGDTSSRTRIYAKTPYNIGFQLNIYAKNHDDALQLVEQIVPYFKPQYSLTIKPLDDYPLIKDDVPITLQAVNFSDDFEGAVESRRTIIYTLDFEMKIDFYGPTSEGKIIETAYVDFFTDDSDIQYSQLVVTTDPSPVSVDSDYTFVETLTRVVDSA